MSAPGMLEHDWFPRPMPENISFGDRNWCYSSYSCLHYRSERPAGVRTGHDTGIYHGTFFDLGPEGEVEIGNYVTLVGAIICTNRKVSIGDYAFLAHEVVLADEFAARPHVAGKPGSGMGSRPGSGIVVGANAWIGARAVLLAGAVIGEGAIVGAFAVVDFEVPPFAIVAGNPARTVGWARTGTARRQEGEQVCELQK